MYSSGHEQAGGVWGPAKRAAKAAMRIRSGSHEQCGVGPNNVRNEGRCRGQQGGAAAAMSKAEQVRVPSKRITKLATRATRMHGSSHEKAEREQKPTRRAQKAAPRATRRRSGSREQSGAGAREPGLRRPGRGEGWRVQMFSDTAGLGGLTKNKEAGGEDYQ